MIMEVVNQLQQIPAITVLTAMLSVAGGQMSFRQRYAAQS